MAAGKDIKHPIVLWAQRTDLIYLTIEVGDMKVEEFKIEGKHFYLKGTDVTGAQTYVVDLEFHANVKGDEKRQIPTSRHLELVIPKDEPKWWPGLLSTKAKVAWIKVDFNKWKDEDDEVEAGGEDNKFDNFDFSSLGLPSGSAGMNNFEDDLGDLSDDDEDMPPLEDADEANGPGKSETKGEKEGEVSHGGDAKEPEETKTEAAHA